MGEAFPHVLYQQMYRINGSFVSGILSVKPMTMMTIQKPAHSLTHSLLVDRNLGLFHISADFFRVNICLKTYRLQH